jgi:hypothetical protein
MNPDEQGVLPRTSHVIVPSYEQIEGSAARRMQRFRRFVVPETRFEVSLPGRTSNVVAGYVLVMPTCRPTSVLPDDCGFGVAVTLMMSPEPSSLLE